MNGNRKHIEKVWSLPYQISLHFEGRDGAPDQKDLKPILRYEGCDDVIARPKVISYSRKKVVIMLEEKLSKHGLGRYELCVHANCCRECDCVKIEFKGDCDITRVTGREAEEKNDNRY